MILLKFLCVKQGSQSYGQPDVLVELLVPVPHKNDGDNYLPYLVWLNADLCKLEAGVHRIPRTLHDGSFVRTPFPTKILTAQEKARKAIKDILFYRAFIYSIHGRCREHALALAHRRICEKSQNSPILIAISDGDIYR